MCSRWNSPSKKGGHAMPMTGDIQSDELGEKPAHLQEQLQIVQARYRRLFESAREGILILDVCTRKITDANPFATKLLGYSHEDIHGKELWEIGLFKDSETCSGIFR